MHRTPFVLDNPVQNYAWGSNTTISELLGRSTPSAKPEAELWIGAHPKAPSRIVAPTGLGTLDAAIEDDPGRILGASVCERFGNQLPFLLKVLAAAEPLSIQAHPNREQARRGWERENAEGIPIDAAHRNYRDPNHKPELVSALSRFIALKGFRPIEEIVRNLECVARPELGPELGRLGRDRTPAGLRALFARLLTLDPEETRAVLDRAATLRPRREGDPSWHWVGRLIDRYPRDPGILAPLYLHLVTLEPGDALFLPAGELHAYLEGSALELMANSDNVLRGGLTAKHVDVPELLATLTFEPSPPERLRAAEISPGERVYRTPAAEFELELITIAPGRPTAAVAGHDVEIMLGLQGRMTVRSAGGATALHRGGALLVPASLTEYTIEGEGSVARAHVP